MTAEELIASGKLELYVCGALPQDEAAEIEQAIEEYPEVKRETELIEASLVHLRKRCSTPSSNDLDIYFKCHSET